jgi:hypothetical protein
VKIACDDVLAEVRQRLEMGRLVCLNAERIDCGVAVAARFKTTPDRVSCFVIRDGILNDLGFEVACALEQALDCHEKMLLREISDLWEIVDEALRA